MSILAGRPAVTDKCYALSVLLCTADHSFTLGINGEIVPIPNFHHETAWFYTQDRVAIVASGSNASPEQLRRKFPSLKDPIHVLRCAIKGWDVVYTGFVCGYGSVPATMIPQKKNDKGKQPTVFVSLVLVNQSQQAKLTKSEKPECTLLNFSPLLELWSIIHTQKFY